MSQISESLFSGQSADGNGSWVHWPGGSGTVFVDGTFGGGTFSLQRESISTPGSGVDLGSDYTLTADGQVNITIAACRLRAALAGATTPSLNARVVSFTS